MPLAPHLKAVFDWTAATREDPKAETRKRLCEQDLHYFVSQAWKVIDPEVQFCDNWHIRAICAHLAAVTEGRIEQLLINVPPGTSKSIITCVMWPAWVWATKPGKRFMFSSYSESLSIRDSIRTRDLIASQWYQDKWKVEFKTDAKERFDNTRGGWRIVGSITGKGIGEHPDYNVADDPHNVLQAESDADRQNVTRWFEGVFCIRGEVRDVKRVLIMQRLHTLDCSGVALEKGRWEHLCLPMKYEPDHPHATTRERPTCSGFFDPRTEDGELLWPALYTPDKVANIEVNLGAYVAAGQLQQRPAPRGGGMFKREWFRVLPESPHVVRRVAYLDKAGTKDGTGAESAIVLLGEYRDETAVLQAMKRKFVVLACIHGRWEAAEREAVVLQTAHAWHAQFGYNEWWLEQEPGSGGKESAQGTVGNMDGFTVYFETVTGDKKTRAEPVASAASVGKVALLAADWNTYLLDELEVFPMGRLKDCVDALSGAYNKLTPPGEGLRGADEFKYAKKFAEVLSTDSKLKASDF